MIILDDIFVQSFYARNIKLCSILTNRENAQRVFSMSLDSGYDSLIRTSVEMGANVNKILVDTEPDVYESSLSFCVRNCSYDTLKLLIDLGANVHYNNSIAIKESIKRKEIAKLGLLLSKATKHKNWKRYITENCKNKLSIEKIIDKYINKKGEL